MSLNEHLNSIILERTIEYNTTQPQNSTAKESNATSEMKSTWKESPKSRAHIVRHVVRKCDVIASLPPARLMKKIGPQCERVHCNGRLGVDMTSQCLNVLMATLDTTPKIGQNRSENVFHVLLVNS